MNALPDFPCYLNGVYTTLPEAKVSVLDRGFIFGDGVYEVVPVYGGRPFFFARHMARLARSLRELRMSAPHPAPWWREIAIKLIADFARSTDTPLEKSDQLLYIQVTRGVALREHAMPDGIAPTVFVMTSALRPPTEVQRRDGVACITADDFRWRKAHIKSVSLLGAVLARQLSVDADAAETVLLRAGLLSEASASNVWMVKDGVVHGPPKDSLVLEGIRYGLLEEICRAEGIGFSLRRISRKEVFAADELLLSSATKEILPVVTLDGQPIGNGRPGPVYAKLHAAYQRLKETGERDA